MISYQMKNKTLIALRSFVIAAGASAAATFVGVFGVFIGATAVEMGWLQSSSTAINNSGQLLWGRISDRVGRRAPFIIFASLASAGLWLFMAFINSPVTLILTYALLSLFSAMIAINWYSLIADNISTIGRGRFLSVINNIASFGTIISVSVMIIFFSGDVSTDIIIPFGAASASYVISAILALKFKEIKSTPKKIVKFRETLGNMKKHNIFYRYFIATNVQALFWSMAWPMFPITVVSLMHFSLGTIGLLTVISLLSSIIGQLFLGRLVDKIDRIPLIFANRLMLCLIPVMYAIFISFKEFIFLEIYSGLVGAIQTTVMVSYMMDIVPTEQKGEYMSLINGVNGIIYFIGALIGGYLLGFFIDLYPLREALLYAYLIVFSGRLISSFLFLRLKEPEKRLKQGIGIYSILLRQKDPGIPSGGVLKPK
ncbi:MAG: MFS transporter [Thermoplasmataceae archaeon]